MDETSQGEVYEQEEPKKSVVPQILNTSFFYLLNRISHLANSNDLRSQRRTILTFSSS